jgi:excisionase family DNA binding protein
MTKSDLVDLDGRLDRIERLVLRMGTQESGPLDLDAAAKYLGVSKSHLYHLTSKGLIGHFKPAGKKIYLRQGGPGFVSQAQASDAALGNRPCCGNEIAAACRRKERVRANPGRLRYSTRCDSDRYRKNS